MKSSLSPLKSIKTYCRQCSGDSPKEVKSCPIYICALFEYRLGRNPRRQGLGRKSPFNHKNARSVGVFLQGTNIKSPEPTHTTPITEEKHGNTGTL